LHRLSGDAFRSILNDFLFAHFPILSLLRYTKQNVFTTKNIAEKEEAHHLKAQK